MKRTFYEIKDELLALYREADFTTVERYKVSVSLIYLCFCLKDIVSQCEFFEEIAIMPRHKFGDKNISLISPYIIPPPDTGAPASWSGKNVNFYSKIYENYRKIFDIFMDGEHSDKEYDPNLFYMSYLSVLSYLPNPFPVINQLFQFNWYKLQPEFCESRTYFDYLKVRLESAILFCDKKKRKKVFHTCHEDAIKYLGIFLEGSPFKCRELRLLYVDYPKMLKQLDFGHDESRPGFSIEKKIFNKVNDVNNDDPLRIVELFREGIETGQIGFKRDQIDELSDYLFEKLKKADDVLRSRILDEVIRFDCCIRLPIISGKLAKLYISTEDVERFDEIWVLYQQNKKSLNKSKTATHEFLWLHVMSQYLSENYAKGDEEAEKIISLLVDDKEKYRRNSMIFLGESYVLVPLIKLIEMMISDVKNSKINEYIGKLLFYMPKWEPTFFKSIKSHPAYLESCTRFSEILENYISNASADDSMIHYIRTVSHIAVLTMNNPIFLPDEMIYPFSPYLRIVLMDHNVCACIESSYINLRIECDFPVKKGRLRLIHSKGIHLRDSIDERIDFDKDSRKKVNSCDLDIRELMMTDNSGSLWIEANAENNIHTIAKFDFQRTPRPMLKLIWPDIEMNFQQNHHTNLDLSLEQVGDLDERCVISSLTISGSVVDRSPRVNVVRRFKKWKTRLEIIPKYTGDISFTISIAYKSLKTDKSFKQEFRFIDIPCEQKVMVKNYSFNDVTLTGDLIVGDNNPGHNFTEHSPKIVDSEETQISDRPKSKKAETAACKTSLNGVTALGKTNINSDKIDIMESDLVNVDLKGENIGLDDVNIAENLDINKKD